MDLDDIILVKVYDSDTAVEAKRCLHASFQLDSGTSGQKLPLRESIELRVLVFTDI